MKYRWSITLIPEGHNTPKVVNVVAETAQGAINGFHKGIQNYADSDWVIKVERHEEIL